MDTREQVRDFLSTRRARLTPAQAGLPSFQDKRRVPGLRREEVALLAGVSVDYYTRLERGSLAGASDGVLEALARALQLDDAERTHLFDLARAAGTSPSRHRSASPQRVRPGVLQLLQTIEGPAWVRNGRDDFVAGNAMAEALFAPMLATQRVRPANKARFVFLDPGAREFFPRWEQVAAQVVGILRAEAGRHPYDRLLTDLVGELSTRSEDFRRRWADHDVSMYCDVTTTVQHPIVGELDLGIELLEMPRDPGLTLVMYTVEPHSRTAQALALLASWSATLATQSSEDAPVTTA